MICIQDHNGRARYLGNVRPAHGTLDRARVYGADARTPALIPEAEWPRLIAALPDGPDDPCLPPVHDQSSVGQCNAEAVCGAMEYTRNRQGLYPVRLSAADLYGRINGGEDSGSTLYAGLHVATREGVGTAETSGRLWSKHTRYATPTERALYRVTEYYLCPTYGHYMSAILSGFAGVAGVLWWADYHPDARGWMAPQGRGRCGGHALFGYKPAVRDGQIGIWHQNSYGDTFGRGGRCVLPAEAFDFAVGGWWAVRQVVTEAADLPTPSALAG